MIGLFIFFILMIICYDVFVNHPKWKKDHQKYESHLISVDIEGESAYWNGIPERNVPYEAGLDEHRSWIEGWESAQCEDREERLIRETTQVGMQK